MLGIEGQGKEVGGVTAEEEGLLSIGVDGRSKKKKIIWLQTKTLNTVTLGGWPLKKCQNWIKKYVL